MSADLVQPFTETSVNIRFDNSQAVGKEFYFEKLGEQKKLLSQKKKNTMISHS